MNRLGLLFWVGLFFLWIIYLRMEKEAEAAEGNTVAEHNEVKKDAAKLIDKNAKM